MMAGFEWPRVPAWTHLYFWQLGANSNGIRFYMISPFCGFLFLFWSFFLKFCLMCPEVFGALPNLWMLLVGKCCHLSVFQ